MPLLTERYAEQIAGVLSCYDRIVITGTLPGLCYAEGMATYLRIHGIRLFDYPQFVEPLREAIREKHPQVNIAPLGRPPGDENGTLVR